MRKIIWYILLVVIFVITICSIKLKLTYIEYEDFNNVGANYTTLSVNNSELKQEFRMPYDIINKISFKQGTFNRDNNSSYILKIVHQSSNKIIYEKRFSGSLLQDNDYNVIDFNKNIAVKKDDIYEIHILAENVNDLTAIAFYNSDDKDSIKDMKYYLNDTEIDGDLCFSIYGGLKDNWWCFFASFIFIYLSILLYKVLMVKDNKKINKDDKLLIFLIAAGIFFFLIFTFANVQSFIDENDNIRGGIVIANGGVLYKDYVTQHTPITYYLCSLFALLGAKSIQQFRLLFYVFESIVWGLMSVRYSHLFEKKRMYLLVAMEATLIPTILYPYGALVLSDAIQGLCIVAFVLEFLYYTKDNRLDLKSSIIISLSFWCSIGAAFISAYSLIFIILLYFFLEIKYWINAKSISITNIVNRYYKLVLSLILPLILVTTYFIINDAFKEGLKQFYYFNREIYPAYINGYGNSFFLPFINAINDFFNVINNNLIQLFNGNITITAIIQLAIIILSISIVVKVMIKKNIIVSLALLLSMVFSATRGYGFHGIAAWNIAILIIAIYCDFNNVVKKLTPTICLVALLIANSEYIKIYFNNMVSKQQPITKIDKYIVNNTSDLEKIFVDSWSHDSIYLLYKKRFAVNRCSYILPWYMDWYEQWTINDIITNKPKIVIYNENESTWGYIDYSNAFLNELNKHYVKVDDIIWLLRE